MSEQHDVLESTKSWLGKVEVGEGRHFRNLTVFPLLVSEEGEGAKPRYELLSDAIEAGAASVEEVDEAGSVPFLAVANKAAIPVLVPEGEILIGAKQNRTVNLTVLVAAGATFKLPVSCVEQGRWSYTSRRFKPAAFAHPKLRNLKMKAAQESRALGYAPQSDQGAVWEEVEDHLHAMEAPASPTRSWTDGYEAAEGRLEDYRKAIELPEGACGFRGGERRRGGRAGSVRPAGDAREALAAAGRCVLRPGGAGDRAGGGDRGQGGEGVSRRGGRAAHAGGPAARAGLRARARG